MDVDIKGMKGKGRETKKRGREEEGKVVGWLVG